MSDWATKTTNKTKPKAQEANLSEVATVSSGGLTTTTKVLIGVGIGTAIFLGISAAVIFTTLALTYTGPFSTTKSTAATVNTTTVSSALANCSMGVYRTTSGSCTTLGTAFNCSSSVSLCGSQATTSGTVVWSGTTANYDDAVTTITLPFSLSLYGLTNSTVGVSTNGVLCIGTCPNAWSAVSLPSSTFSNPSIFIFYADLCVTSGTAQVIRYAIVGSAPSRMFVLELFVGMSGGSSLVSSIFLVMYEDIPDVVRIEYVYTYNGGAQQTLGVQKTASGPSIQYSFVQASVNNGTVLIYNTYARAYSG